MSAGPFPVSQFIIYIFISSDTVYIAFIICTKTGDILTSKTGKEVFEMRKILNKKVMGIIALAMVCVLAGTVP